MATDKDDKHEGASTPVGDNDNHIAAGTTAMPQPQNTSAPAAELPPAKPKSRRGFASMDPDLVRRIASQGGQAAHRSGNAHQFTSEEARRAGAKSSGRRKKPDASS